MTSSTKSSVIWRSLSSGTDGLGAAAVIMPTLFALWTTGTSAASIASLSSIRDGASAFTFHSSARHSSFSTAGANGGGGGGSDKIPSGGCVAATVLRS